MKELAFSTIKELQEKIKNKELSRSQLLSFFLDRFAQFDGDLGSSLEIFDAESILSASADSGVLCGIPGLLKDNISQKGRKLSCASKILQGYTATYDATASARLKESGALLIGRANMDEFAMGSSNETSAFYPVKNPWDKQRVPGGSSGGSIAAVAAGLVPWALGTDTGGSVRQPAAFCGIVGIKPTYGLISRYGVVAYASTLDQIGVATRTVYDNALVLSQIAGSDPKDSSSALVDKKDYTYKLQEPLPSNFTIGIIDNALTASGMDDQVRAAIEQVILEYQKMGVTIKRIAMPMLEYGPAAYFILSRAEAASNLARFDGVRYGMRSQDIENLQELYANTRQEGFGLEVRSRIMVGNYVLSASHSGAYYENAKRAQRLIRRDFFSAFKDVNVLLMPTHPAPAFKFGAYDVDKLQMDLQDYFTCMVNLAGIPAIALPCGFSSDNLPIGFQLLGPHFSEDLLYRAAHAYEKVTPWHTMHPQEFCK